MAASGGTDGVLITGVKFADKEEDDDAPQKGYLPDFATANVRERAAHLYADPKMVELKHYIKSHRHEERLRVAAELEARQPIAESPKRTSSRSSSSTKANQKLLRSEGCKAVDRHMKKLATEKAVLPRIGACCADAPPELVPADHHRIDRAEVQAMHAHQTMMNRMDRFQTRLQWRSGMDYSLRRLIVDLELAQHERLKEYSNQARCNHLDKIYDWYTAHGMKEARKERIAPPYIRFQADGRVMPGSLRAPPPMLRRKGVGRSASSPALPSAAVITTA
eukprot:TRINITY_DN75786_c0_g1_i1.p1 TRINITY_DN75786_c0_g1~~TRINITY_DN75786_c0_g1_i1.p1  ORF type:complete len:304 (+),score=55.21 TRINITY_DN75786_c0_g1_i1:80-913(+)